MRTDSSPMAGQTPSPSSPSPRAWSPSCSSRRNAASPSLSERIDRTPSESSCARRCRGLPGLSACDHQFERTGGWISLPVFLVDNVVTSGATLAAARKEFRPEPPSLSQTPHPHTPGGWREGFQPDKRYPKPARSIPPKRKKASLGKSENWPL